MSTYLEICQAVARESGTVSVLGQPETTVGQTGRLQRILNWVNTAYGDIQRAETTWRWLQYDFKGQTIAAVGVYDAAAMGIAGRFSRWVDRGEEGENFFSLYKTSDGPAEEGFLRVVNWQIFRRHYLIGNRTTEQGKPSAISIDDQGKLRLYPLPDDVYTLRGRYVRSPQKLISDHDVPEMPQDFHDAIQWKALTLMGLFDEDVVQVPWWQGQFMEVMEQLRNQQLPSIKLPGPLA